MAEVPYSKANAKSDAGVWGAAAVWRKRRSGIWYPLRVSGLAARIIVAGAIVKVLCVVEGAGQHVGGA